MKRDLSTVVADLNGPGRCRTATRSPRSRRRRRANEAAGRSAALPLLLDDAPAARDGRRRSGAGRRIVPPRDRCAVQVDRGQGRSGERDRPAEIGRPGRRASVRGPDGDDQARRHAGRPAARQRRRAGGRAHDRQRPQPRPQRHPRRRVAAAAAAGSGRGSRRRPLHRAGHDLRRARPGGDHGHERPPRLRIGRPALDRGRRAAGQGTARTTTTRTTTRVPALASTTASTRRPSSNGHPAPDGRGTSPHLRLRRGFHAPRPAGRQPSSSSPPPTRKGAPNAWKSCRRR